MSYWVALQDEDTGKACVVPLFDDGGTRIAGGSTDAELNITYNYNECYRLVPELAGEKFGVDWLQGRRARSAVTMLDHVTRTLGDHTYQDYWAPTPGNASRAVAILLAWARLHPEATFHVS